MDPSWVPWIQKSNAWPGILHPGAASQRTTGGSARVVCVWHLSGACFVLATWSFAQQNPWVKIPSGKLTNMAGRLERWSIWMKMSYSPLRRWGFCIASHVRWPECNTNIRLFRALNTCFQKRKKALQWKTIYTNTGWWFQTFSIFTPTWGNDPFWLIFFKGVETTN